MRILITGAAGMLGAYVEKGLVALGNEVHVSDIIDANGFTYSYCDVRDPASVESMMHRSNPDLVAHLAAETSLELSERNPMHAWLTNAIGTKNVALACRRAVVPMAYISSAGVFDGEQAEPYTEFDTPHPINVYGKSKFAGEQFVRQLVPEYFIVRAGWMMGGGPRQDHKFVHHITEQLLAGERNIKAVDDKFGTPTYAPDFGNTFAHLLATRRFGTYHMASPGVCSRFDVARAIVEGLGLSDRVSVDPVASGYFAEEFFAPRPRSEAMANLVLDLEGRNTMRPWPEALAEYLQEWS